MPLLLMTPQEGGLTLLSPKIKSRAERGFLETLAILAVSRIWTDAYCFAGGAVVFGAAGLAEGGLVAAPDGAGAAMPDCVL